jgi:hypothetical protein
MGQIGSNLSVLVAQFAEASDTGGSSQFAFVFNVSDIRFRPIADLNIYVIQYVIQYPC